MTNIRGDLSQAFGSVADIFAALGDFVNMLLNEERAVYFIVLLIMIIVTGIILKIMLSHVPFFRGSGAHQTNRSGSIIAWSLATGSVVILNYQIQSMDMLINMFAGPHSIYLITGFAAFAAFGVYKGFDRGSHERRGMWATGIFLIVWLWLYSATTGNKTLLTLFIIAVILVAGVGLLSHLRRSH